MGPHEILGGGTGTFVVSGTIFVNSDVAQQPWTSSSSDLEWDDAIDAKTSSNLYVYGPVETVAGTYNGEALWPLDHCFQPAGPKQGSNPGTLFASGDPTASSLPTVQLSCSEASGSVTFDYNSMSNTSPQIADPLAAAERAASPPTAATTACPGMSTVVDPTPQVVGGVTELLPGDYTSPVELTGSTNFQDCSGFGGNEGAYPGIYRFEQGLWINPGPGDTVTGNNVVISTGTPYPMAGNVPGTVVGGNFQPSGPGNGAPCLPSSTMTSKASGNGSPQPETSSHACGGTSPTTYGVTAYGDSSIAVDNSMSGTGNNFSLMIGGASGDAVNLTGPTTGPYAGVDGSPGIVLYQDSGTQANYGFDAEAGDAAIINLTGVVYNASLTNYGTGAPADYWDGVGGGIPFYAGGTLQTGFGAGMVERPGAVDRVGHDHRHRHRRRLQHRREHQHHDPRPALQRARQQQPVVHRMTQMRSSLQSRRRDETGATLVEFALVAPLVFLLIFGLIGGSYLAFQNSSLHDGATAGARMASIETGLLTQDNPATGTPWPNGLYCESDLPVPIEKAVSGAAPLVTVNPAPAVRHELGGNPAHTADSQR